ncbi:MAG: sialidase family protein [Phycisphaerae bacterium]
MCIVLNLGIARLSASESYTFGTQVRIAYSEDGQNFRSTGSSLAAHASSPSIAMLPNGTLIAIVNASVTDENEQDIGLQTLATTRSADGGQTWSDFQPIRMNEAQSERSKPRRRRSRSSGFEPLSGMNAALVRLPDGTIQMFFDDPVNQRARRSSKRGRVSLVRSARSRDGLTFTMVDDVRLPARHDRGLAGVHPVAAWIANELHLYIHEPNLRRGRRLQHLISQQGRRFERDKARLPQDVLFVGSIIALPGQQRDGVRAYVSGERGIRTLVSRDGSRWTPEPAITIEDAWDPSVIRLPDGDFLMLYCTPLRSHESDGGLAARDGLTWSAMEADGEPVFVSADAPLAEVRWHRQHGRDGASDLTDGGQLSSADDGGVVAVAEPGTDADGAYDAAMQADTSSTESEGSTESESQSNDVASNTHVAALMPVVDQDGFVELPDFDSKLDYFEWFASDMLGNPPDNAYHAYDKIFGKPWDEPGAKPAFPTIRGLYNDGVDGPPGPWDPADHPEWVASIEATADLFEQFRDATHFSNYAMPMDDAYRANIAQPDGTMMLIGIQLPSLWQHRATVKGLLSAAWRKSDGRVPPERMRDAVATTLRSANHMSQGATLIEQLVGLAERGLAYQTARWALKHGVFEGEQIADMLGSMRRSDAGPRDPRAAVRGEHAMTMDLVQGAFWPASPSGEPSLREDRIPQWSSAEENERMLNDLRQLNRDDLHAAVSSIDSYYRELSEMMAVGYPEVRSNDIAEMADEYVSKNAIARHFLPSLSRVHFLRTRYEAERRATLAAYAAYDYRENFGRWPSSMRELRRVYGDEITTDPFTGHDFGYSLTGDEPRIYSAGDNGVDEDGRNARQSEDLADGSDDHLFWPPSER